MNGDVRRDEAGVTLIELLVTVSIMGILMAALTGALVMSFRTTRDTHTSLDQSNAEQIITTFVTKDVQAADAVVPPTTTCDGLTPKLEVNTRLHPQPIDPNTNPVVKVSYALRANGELLRCKDVLFSTIAHDVTDFTTSGTDIVATTVKTAASTEVPDEVRTYEFSFEVRRRQA